MKKILLVSSSLFFSGLLILSIPILNYLILGNTNKDKQLKTTPVSITREIKQAKPPTPKRKPSTPNTKRPQRSQVKAGPRFAMNLDVAGQGGVEVSMDLAKKGSGNKSYTEGEIDEAPSLNTGLVLRNPPAEVKKREIDASVRLVFCVNTAGKAYDIRVSEEIPPGLGMAEAGKEALQSAQFQPARKEGAPVAFCGMEQELAVRFDD